MRIRYVHNINQVGKLEMLYQSILIRQGGGLTSSIELPNELKLDYIEI